MSNLPIVTVASKNYLAQARVLAQSYLAHHPDGKVFVCLVDRIDSYFDPQHEPFTIILVEDLAIPQWDYLSFRYTALELNCAVKPFIIEHILRTYGFEGIIYFDADIVIHSPLAELDGLLDQFGVILTPHILKPIDDDYLPSEISFLQTGLYNLGFLAVSGKTTLDALLKWWQARLMRYCVDDRPRGLFTDQRWADYFPVLFPNVSLWRNQGANVAYWNLVQRTIERRGDTYLIDGQPLVFMHFSGYRFDDIEAVSVYQNRFRLKDLSEATQELLRDYRERLLASGYEVVRRWPYAYAAFSNGLPVSDVIRRFYREVDPVGERWPEPTQTGAGSFFEFLTAAAESSKAGQRPYLTQLGSFIYRTNRHIQQFLPDGLHQQRYLLMLWLCTDGKIQFALPEALISPMRPQSLWQKITMLIHVQLEIGGLALRRRAVCAYQILLNSDSQKLRAWTRIRKASG